MAISLTGMRSVKVATFDISPHHPMQSFVRDVITGQWYVAQLNGTTDGVENLWIYRCSPDGQVLDKANLVKAGHGNSITIEHDGGNVYIWLRWTGINKPIRWKYSGTVAGKTITSSHADVQQYTSLEPSNTSTAYYSIDEQAGRIASYRGQADGTHYLELRNLADYKTGTGSALHTIDITDYGVMQGFATVGDQVLVYRGAGYASTDQHPPEIRVYSWTTGAETGRLDVSGASGVNPGDASINEAEGIYVTPEGTIMHGLATGLMGTNVSTVYRLTSQSETVGEVGRATLVLDLQEVTGEPMGDASVQVSYDRDVRTPGAGIVPRLPEGYIPLADRDRVQVVASDDPALSPESYGHRVRIDVRRGFPHGDKTYYAQTSIDGAAEVALSRILVPGPGKPGEMLRGPKGDPGPVGPAGRRAVDTLAAYRGNPDSDLTVAIAGDTTWTREWATTYGASLPESVRREYHAWNGASWDVTMDAAGEGTPDQGGPTVVDTFDGDGPLSGRAAQKGGVWTAAAAWTTSNGQAKASGNGIASLDATVGDGVDANFDFSIITTPTAAAQSWRIHIAATANRTSSFWVALTINTSGYLTATLYKTIGGTSTSLGGVPVSGVASSSSTPQQVRATLSLRGQSLQFDLTKGGSSVASATVDTGTAAPGTLVVLENLGATSGLSLDAITAGTPLIPGESTGPVFTVQASPGVDAAQIPVRFPSGPTPDILLVAAGQTLGQQYVEAFAAAHPQTRAQIVNGADVPVLTMPTTLVSAVDDLDQRLASIEQGGTSGGGVSALDRLQTLQTFAAGTATVAVVSDSTANDRNDWLRVWASKWGATVPTPVRRVYNDWDAAANTWRTPVVDSSGSTPDQGVIVEDDFSTAGEIVGSTPDSGPTWAGSAPPGWSSDGTLATLTGSASKTISQNLGATDQTVRVTLSLVTTGQSAAQTFRVYAGSAASGLYTGVWASLSVSTSGHTSVALYTTINGTTTTLAGTTPVTGLTTSSATPQEVVVTLTTNIQNVAATVTVADQTTTVTGTITESDVSTLGNHAGVVGIPSASFTYGFRLAAFHAHTPAADNPAQGPTLTVWNAAIAGSKIATFDQAKRAAMFGGKDIDLLIFAMGHNHGTQTPAGFVAEVEAFLDDWRDEHPGCAVLISSQNPQVSPSATVAAHAARQAALRIWAREHGHDYLPVFEAFMARADGGQSLVGPDGVHPTTAPVGTASGDYGSVLWADTAITTLGA